MWVGEEMKMSDVFDGDVRHFGGGNIGDDRCDEFALAQFEDSTEAEYTCHAINNHDRMVEENLRLTELAAQKASRADELFEALVAMVEQFGEPDGSDFVNEADYAVVTHAKKLIFMQKNGLGEQDMLGGDIYDVR